MGREIEGQAAMATPPVEAQVWRFAGETSTKAYVVPSTWQGKFIEWESEKAGTVHFGIDENVSVTDSQDSTRAGAGSSADPYTLTVNNASGWRFRAYEPISWYVPKHLTHFAVILDAAGDVQVSEASG